MGEWIRACSVEQLPDGQMHHLEHDGKKILIARVGEKLFAADSTCTHEEADLTTGFLTKEGVRCPLHLSVFDLETGAPQNPPAQKSIRTYNVKIDGSAIYVEV